MRLIFLYGMPASGKLTVGQELAALTGYKLFHNHLVVDLLLSVFEFGSAPFIALREEIWLSVFEKACRSGSAGMIFTFAPEPTVRREFPAEAVRVVGGNGGRVDFVELRCSLEEIKRRLVGESRLRYRKLTSLEVFEEMDAEGSWDCSRMPAPALIVDTSAQPAAESALEIARVLGVLPYGPATHGAVTS